MLQRLHEPIRVAVIHGPGTRLRPVWFDWQKKKHAITEITYHWRHQAGDDSLLHYSVTDGTALYELVYNASQQLWLLESVDPDRS
jgi:hypothetical protein